MEKYIKVVFGNKSGAKKDLEYKIGELNVAEHWNPNAKSGKEFGGFNFSTESKILRWLHRGDTIYEVELPDDAEVVDIVESATPHGVFRANKIILKNPVKITDEKALELYKKSDIPEEAYYTSLAVVSVMGYRKTANQILKDKVNANNVKKVLEEWKSFIYKKEKNRTNELVKEIEDKLKKINKNVK